MTANDFSIDVKLINSDGSVDTISDVHLSLDVKTKLVFLSI